MANLDSAAIVVFTERHRESVKRLWRRVFPSARDADLERDINQAMAFYPDLLLVAESDGEICGTAMSGYDGHRGWIYYLAVAPNMRGHGLAKRLVKESESRLARLGCAKVNLQVRANNRDAVGFYIRCGYRMEDRISFGKRL